jgi:hypothetical protein
MKSQRKTQANRSNSRKSSGPITAEGKRTASRNSRKHGLASVAQPAASADIERLAAAFCDDQNDPALLAQARIIAENDLVLRTIREHKLNIIERLRDPNGVERRERDECEALEGAVPDLICLERYERRAWSRQSRAMWAFMNIKLMCDMRNGNVGNPR